MSKLPFELLLALRYLRPKRTFVSIITLISVVGVALGVAVLIIVISVMSGFDHDMREQILGFNAHLKIYALDKSGRTEIMGNYADVMRLISSNKNVCGVAPIVLGQVLVETEPAGTNVQQALTAAPYLRGADVNAENSVSVLPRRVIVGTFDLSGQSVVVGKDFANNMNLSVGDRLAVYSPDDLKKMRQQHGTTTEVAILPNDYRVTGIFDVGFYDFDANFIVTSLENAQDLYNLGENVHGLLVMLDNPTKAGVVKRELGNSLGANYQIRTWLEDSPMLAAVIVEKNVMLYIMFFIVIVAAFGITCTLITFVVMKTREIGLLKAVGASNRQVMSVFVCQSVIISIFGVACGLGLGLFALHVRNDFLHLMNRLTGWELFPSSIYGFSELPAIVNPGDILIICGGSLVICLIAAVLPARHASKMNTVEALRHE